MFPGSVGRIVEAFLRIPGVDADVAQEVANAIANRDQSLEHHGSVTIRGTLPVVSRDYSSRTSADNLHPVPPVNDPAITGALLTLDNQPIGDSDRRGENGFALAIPRGILRNQGESWIAKHALIESVTAVTDGRSTRITTSGMALTRKHYVADGFECGDQKGRDLTDVPIRVFYPSAGSLPAVSSVVSYMRDQSGLATPLGPGGVESNLQWADATTAWQWHSEGTLTGYSVFNVVNDHHGNGADATTVRIYLQGSAKMTPNVQTGDRVGWLYDANGERAAVCGHEDGWIDKVVMHNGTVESIPKGWVLHSRLTGRFPVGYDPDDDDYNANGLMGGNHPLRPRAHRESDPRTSTVDYNAKGWYDSAWLLDDHVTALTVTSVTNISIDIYSFRTLTTLVSATGITIEPHVAPVSETVAANANIGVDDHVIAARDTQATTSTGTVSSTTIDATSTLTSNAVLTINDHDVPARSTLATTSTGTVSSTTIDAASTLVAVAGLTIGDHAGTTQTDASGAVVSVNSTSIGPFTSGGTVATTFHNATSVVYGPTQPSASNISVRTSLTSTSIAITMNVTIDSTSQTIDNTSLTINNESLTIGGSATAENSATGVTVSPHTSHTHSASSSWVGYDTHTMTCVGATCTLSFGVGEFWSAFSTSDRMTLSESHPLVHSISDSGHGHTVPASGLTIPNHAHTIGDHAHPLDDHSHTGSAASSASSTTSLAHIHGLIDLTHQHSIAAESHSHYSWTPVHNHEIEFDHGHGVTIGGHLHPISTSGFVHDITDDGHRHTSISSIHTHGLAIDPHLHEIAQITLEHVVVPGGHLHPTQSTTHAHGTANDEHFHEIAASSIPSHSHTTTDPGHQHSTPTLAHGGELYHREEDFRPPYCSIMFIQRVGPDDD